MEEENGYYLSNGKWDGIWDRPKYQEFRDKITNTFSELVFDEGPHKYYLHGKEIECVSNITHMFKEEFDAEQKSIETYERNFENPNSKYYQMTPEQIRESWLENSRQACSHGTERHEFGESCYYFMTGQYDKILPAFKDRLEEIDGKKVFKAIYPKEIAAAKYWNDLPVCYVPIMVETKVYREDLGYSGTFDLLMYYDTTLNDFEEDQGGFIVMDWKTNKDLYKNFNNQRLLKPFEGLLDCPLSLYKLQQSLYELALTKIGLRVVGRRLMWLKPNGTYEKISLENYAEKLERILSDKNR